MEEGSAERSENGKITGPVTRLFEARWAVL